MPTETDETGRKKGFLLVISSPSGAGKTTLCQRLRKEFPEVGFSVSFTTRPRRHNEQDGVHYHFVDRDTFQQMLDQGALAEWAQVHDELYGTSRATVDHCLDRGQVVLFDIDWQGAGQLKRAYPEDTVMVFVLPPSMAVLERRLRGRGTDAPEVVALRLDNARGELKRHTDYHYLVVNDDLDRAYRDLRAIYLAAGLATERQPQLVARLLAELKDSGA
jgi:guanylate kinase